MKIPNWFKLDTDEFIGALLGSLFLIAVMGGMAILAACLLGLVF